MATYKNGTIGSPVVCDDLDDAFSVCRDRNQPVVVQTPEKTMLCKVYPSGRLVELNHANPSIPPEAGKTIATWRMNFGPARQRARLGG